MMKSMIVASFVLAPAVVLAQTSARVQTRTEVKTSGSTNVGNGSASTQGSTTASSSTAASSQSGHRLSADAQSQIEANLRVARERRLPEQPIRRRVAEGEAKGASEAQIVAASRRTLIDLQTSHDAIVRAGRTSPSDEEVSRGAQLMARGYTSAQIEAVAAKASADRSLVVAFDVLTSLQAQGKSTANAVTQVEAQLASHASDAQLRGIAVDVNSSSALNGAVNLGRSGGSASGSTNGSAAGSASTTSGGSPAAGAGSVAGSAAAGAGAAASGALTGAHGGVTGAVNGTVSGALGKRP